MSGRPPLRAIGARSRRSVSANSPLSARTPPPTIALRVILAFSILSTAAHYSHNFVEMDRYPGGGVGQQVLIVLSWPVLTAIGVYGYRLYVRGELGRAHACLIIYSLTGLVTPLHFAYGEPDIPAFFYATIFTDFIAGLAVVAFVAWSASRPPGLAAQRRP